MRRSTCVLGLFLVATVPAIGDEAPWSTYRGNVRRSGNTDGIAGPARPEVIWVIKDTKHFVAAPVPNGADILLPGLSGFNEGVVSSLPINPKDPKNITPTWVKGGQLLGLPTVSSPAVSDGKVTFGGGMHDSPGAALYCYPTDGSCLLWVLQMKGPLMHMEASPTVANGRVYTGGGAAGVVCVDLNTVTLNGKEMSVKDVPAAQSARLKELQAKYEVEKKKDPEFAIAPGEDQLWRPAPKTIWMQGEKRWHVDAPVLVAGDKVLAASAFLDKEKEGDRAVYCLDAGSGKELWRASLTYNPWGGPTLAGETVIVTTSSIAYKMTDVEQAKGEVVALDLATGKEKWKKLVPGGVLGCAAATNDAAVFTCTDGKVRAFALADGSRKIIYDAKAPFFAPPAVVGDTAYVADLNGVVHAIDLKTGNAAWTFDLGKEPLKLPGMNYGGITVHGGRLYLATFNRDGPFAGQSTAVVCIGGK
ncbi:MAG TPA: PQQ-binding-like beta-propeller repeat protein [Gemmataceae bacterium]|nr:PQQ-binding-like beta-propeller repeat protein [Gemmataceae bacterium]